MNLRRLAGFALLALLFALPSCGTVNRAGKDLGIVVTSPFVILYGAGVDGLSTAKEAREGMNGGAATEVLVFIPAVLFHGVKHALYVVLHAIDFCLFPFYGITELHPYGREVEPLDYYTGTIFDKKPEDMQKTQPAEPMVDDVTPAPTR